MLNRQPAFCDKNEKISEELMNRTTCQWTFYAFYNILIMEKTERCVIGMQENKVWENSNSGDRQICQVYSKIPRSMSFVKKCMEEGKQWMGQLEEKDFDDAITLKGIGADSVEKLRQVYYHFKTNSDDCVVEKTDEIAGLPLSSRAINSLKKAGIVSFSTLLGMSEAELYNIKSMGKKTCGEILNYLEGLTPEDYGTLDEEPFCLQCISKENDSIPIELLKTLNVGQQEIDFLKNAGYKTVGDCHGKKLPPRLYARLKHIETYLDTPIEEYFTDQFQELGSNARAALIERSLGGTLQEIGDVFGLSRERVRQIINTACSTLCPSAELIAGALLKKGSCSFSTFDIKEKFTGRAAAIVQFVLLHCDYVQYFKFCGKYVLSSCCPKDLNDIFNRIATDVIGDGINFYDNLEQIEKKLKKNTGNAFDFQDFKNYLVQNKYHFYGDYVTKGKQPYAMVCCDAIRKYFDFDLKLDSDQDNEDMARLRQILGKYYQGLKIPALNRALTAAITRDGFQLVLSGRGRYCPIEKVAYNIALLDEICDFIRTSQQTSFYYSELFIRFQDRLIVETNINNHHFLHGILRALYPGEFTYERDLLVKNGTARQDVNHRIHQLIISRSHAISREDIKKAIPGINDSVITFSVMRIPDMIQWEDNCFNHMDNIETTAEEKDTLKAVLQTILDAHTGYASDTLLFKAAQRSLRDYLARNQMNNAQNLYYVTANLFRD